MVNINFDSSHKLIPSYLQQRDIEFTDMLTVHKNISYSILYNLGYVWEIYIYKEYMR